MKTMMNMKTHKKTHKNTHKKEKEKNIDIDILEYKIII